MCWFYQVLFKKSSVFALGLLLRSDFLRNLECTWASYLSRQGELSIHEAGEDKSANRELVYDGGSLVAAALDLQIRITDAKPE